MKRKGNLDEMQEQELLKIEHNACWLAFWGLLIALIIESFAFGSMKDTGYFQTLCGEWIVFMVLALYLAVACVRRGIWDRKLAMNTKTNLMISAVAAIATGLINAAKIFWSYHMPMDTAIAAVITAVITFVICFVILTVLMKQTKKRKAAMEAEPEDANEM